MLEHTAMGNQSILLQACTFDDFPIVANKWASILGGKLGKLIHGPDQVQGDLTINDRMFWLAHDIWQVAISLEPQDDNAAKLIPELFLIVQQSA